MPTRNAVRIGKRVYLRPIEVADANALSAASHLEQDGRMLQAGRVPTSAIAFEAWIRGLGTAGPPSEVVFAICRVGEDACIGTTSLRAIDWVHRTAETGIGLLEEGDRGQGIGTEAKHLLLEHAFHDLGLLAICTFIFAGNARSAAAVRKQGYRLAGRLTAEVQRGGRFHDMLVFDITREEWERARKPG